MTIESHACSPEDNPNNGIESISNEERLTINRYFINIYNTHYTELLRIAVFKLSDVQLAEDIVNEVFANFYEYLTIKGQDPAILFKNIDAYLMKCVKNKIIDHYRKKSHPNSPIDDGFRSPSNTHQLVEDQMLEERTFFLINRLSENQKKAILMFYEGYPQKEIAEQIYGKRDSAAINCVKALLTRAKGTLKNEFSDYW